MSWVDVVTPQSVAPPSVALEADTWLHARGPAAGTGRAHGSFAKPVQTKWRSTTADAPAVLDVLASGDRIALVREPDTTLAQRVDVLDRSGAPLHTIVGRRGPWILDPRGPMLLGSARDGDPTAWSLAMPSPILWSTRFEGRQLADLRLLDDLLVAIARQPRTFRGPDPSVLAATIRIQDYADVSQFDTLRSTACIAESLAGSTEHVVLGVDAEGPILAADDRVSWMDWSLQLRAELDLAGHPRLLGPRGDGRCWMLATKDDEAELRLLAPGTCELATPVHPTFRDAERLLVTPDDGAILVAPTRIQSFDAYTGFRWKFARDGAARALVDSTGTTLFTHGPALIAADPDGTCRELWRAPSSPLGPIAIAGDLLLVAAGPDVFALAW